MSGEISIDEERGRGVNSWLRVRVLPGLSGCAAFCVGVTALAEPLETTARTGYALEYEAPVECQTSEALRAALEARGVPLEPAATRGAMIIHVARVDGRYQGTLTLEEAGSGRTERQLESDDCAELSSAIVLIAGLLARREPSDATETHPQPANPRPSPSPPTPEWEDERPVDSEEAANAERARMGVGAGFLVHGGVAPGLAYGGLAFTELRGQQRGVFAPALRVGIAFARGASDRPEGSARLDWLAGRAWFAPFRWPDGPVGVELAALVEAGRLHATATRAQNATDRSGVWLGAGVELAAEAELSGFAVVVGAGAVFPLVRDRFYLGPGTTLHRAAPVVETGRVALVLRFR